MSSTNTPKGGETARMSHTPSDVSLTTKPDDASDDLRWRTTKRELWAYSSYYIGNNGMSGFIWGPSQFQNLLSLAATCDSNGNCTLPFAGQQRTVTSIVLDVNGISFAIQAVLLLICGAWADVGSWRPNILIFVTLAGVAGSFGWLGVEDPSKWRVGVFLYILGSICAQLSITFWAAAFPGLARNSVEVEESERLVSNGKRSPQEHATVYSLARNKILNVSYVVSSAVEVCILAVMVGILFGVHVEDSVQNNTRGYAILLAVSGAIWLIFAIPWFLIEKRRPGLSLPPATSLVTVGFVQTYQTLKQIFELKQTFLYFIFYFCMGDVMNTSVTVISTIQYALLEYSTLKITYTTILFIGSQMLGIATFWLIQKHFKIRTKTMLIVNVFCIVLLTLWGLIGIWTTKFGFHSVWEIYVFQVYHGFLISPWYAYSQTMISEVTPAGYEFLFFGIFAISGKSASFIGPIISSAIISASPHAGVGQSNMPFTFLFALGVVSYALLFFVDVEKSRQECAAFVKRRGERGWGGVAQSKLQQRGVLKAEGLEGGAVVGVGASEAGAVIPPEPTSLDAKEEKIGHV